MEQTVAQAPEPPCISGGVPRLDTLPQAALKPAAPARRGGPPTIQPHHVRRMEQVLDYVELHLAEDLELDLLAELAAMSPFHFHRLFQAWIGETARDFVRRRRLEAAASRLRHCPGEPVTAISLACGYASSEAFARAFKDHFAMTPTQWRAGGWADWRGPVTAVRIDAAWPRIQITRQGPIECLYMRAHGDYAASCEPLWDRFLPWIEGLGLAGQPLMSMGIDDPAVTSPQRCRLDACVQLPRGWGHPGQKLPRKTIPAGCFASLHYDGPSRHIGRGWDALLNGWLPESSFALGEGHFFERYDPRTCRPARPMVRCELLMPIQTGSAH